MTFESYKIHFIEKAVQHGYSLENIQRCLSYSQKLLDQNLPVVYDAYHLSGLVGYNYLYIKRSIISTKFFYREFNIRKKNGSVRVISEPLPSLKEIQYWILHEILYKKKVSRYAKGYIPKKGIREHLRYHTNENQVLTLDLANFFTSIKKNLVRDLFFNLGYSRSVSDILASLCTLDNCLPQGAPTSPYLSNLLLRDFDEAVGKFCISSDLKFSRYADDLAFSGKTIHQSEIVDFVKQEINLLGLKINSDKTVFMERNVKQIISGIIVNEKMQVPKTKRNDIRNIMFYVKKFGIESHMSKIKRR